MGKSKKKGLLTLEIAIGFSLVSIMSISIFSAYNTSINVINKAKEVKQINNNINIIRNEILCNIEFFILESFQGENIKVNDIDELNHLKQIEGINHINLYISNKDDYDSLSIRLIDERHKTNEVLIRRFEWS